MMLSLEEIVKRLHDRNLKEVSRGAGVNYFSVIRLVKTKSELVEYKTIKRLSDYLESNL